MDFVEINLGATMDRFVYEIHLADINKITSASKLQLVMSKYSNYWHENKK